MTEWWLRTLVALVVIAVPMIVTWRLGRSRRPWIGQMPRDLGPFPSVLLFTSPSCPTCGPAGDVVRRVGGERVQEFAWPRETVAFHKLGVGRVPSTFVVGRSGRVVEAFEGIPDERRLARAVKRAGS